MIDDSGRATNPHCPEREPLDYDTKREASMDPVSFVSNTSNHTLMILPIVENWLYEPQEYVSFHSAMSYLAYAKQLSVALPCIRPPHYIFCYSTPIKKRHLTIPPFLTQ